MFKFNPLNGKLEIVQDTSVLVPYTGATGDVDLGLNTLITRTIGRDTDNKIAWTTDDKLDIRIAGATTQIASITAGVADNDKLVTQGYVDDAVSVENLWDRAGTALFPHTSGDDLAIDGDIYANKKIGINLLAGNTPSKELDIKGYFNFVPIANAINTMAYALSGTAGNVDDGVHRYKVTYYNSDGETGLSSVYLVVTVVDKSTSGQVLLSDIPVSICNFFLPVIN